MIRAAILLLFFSSGATALIYEVIWSKYLALMFGSTIHAQTVVLAVFMGGLALGNRLFGAWADRTTRPLAMYGYLEVALGLYATGFRWLYDLANAAFVSLGSPLLERGPALLLLKGTLSVGLLLTPTVVMGGTLPLLAAWLQRSTADPGRRSARFYSTNSLGAVCGAGLAGFFLVQLLGLRGTLEMTALANALIGFTAILLSGLPSAGAQERTAETPGPEAGRTAGSANETVRVACLMVGLTGAVSMGLEVLASRCLVLIFGASLQAFAVVLMAFILGIGLGSAVVASPRLGGLRREATTVILLLAAAGTLGIFISTIEFWVDLYRHVKTGLARTDTGFLFHQIFITAMSLAVLGTPAALLGAVLPLWIRGVADPAASLANQVGRLLTWNTLGAVAGVLLTGFVLMPRLGLRGAFGALAIGLCAAAGLIARAHAQRRAVFAAVGMMVALAWTGWQGGEGWRMVLSSGVFRARETTVDRFAMDRRREHYRLLFYEDAADATVSVEQGDGLGAPSQLSLRINGKVDASSEGDLATQYLLGHLPLLARPESKDVFVLGFGSGITAGAVLGHPIDRLVIAENCAPVLRAGKLFEPWNRGVLTNSRTKIWNEDARTVLQLSPQTYDAIISEPSNPWMAGVGSVFSQEFYELAARRLKPGGIMTQWFHLYEMDDEIVGMVLRTFSSVFPQVEIWDAGAGDIILLGSKQPWRSEPSVYQKTFGRSAPRRDLESVGLMRADFLWARQIASQRTAFAIPGGGGIQSDEFPVLEYAAPKAFFRGENSRLMSQFDERTWEAPIADARKRSVLASLDSEAVDAVFKRYSSANPDIAKYILSRARARGQAISDELYAGHYPVPFAFAAGNAPPQPLPVPPNATEELKRLLAAEASLQVGSERWREAVESIKDILRTLDLGKSPDVHAWPTVHFASVAVKACLQRGDLDLARTVLEMSLKYRHAGELRYLARIVDRESVGDRAASSNLRLQPEGSR